MEPLISICIPNYNYEKYIGETIDSILSQTYQNFEIIICDNASTDGSINIIKNYTDERICLYTNSKNINLYENINKAISYSNGELICILHSDDFYHENFLEEIVKAYNKYSDKKVFVTGVYNYHTSKKLLNAHSPYDSEGIKKQNEVITRLLYGNNIGNGVNVCLHKDVIKAAGMYSSAYRFASDYDFWLRIANYFEFVYIPKILAFYRIHDNNLSHSVNKNIDMFIEGQNILRTFLDNIIFKERKKSYYRLIRHRIYVKAIEFTLKYESGLIASKMLEEMFENRKAFSKDILFYLISLLSKFVNEKNSKKQLAVYRFLFRVVMFIPNALNMQRLKELVLLDNIEIKKSVKNKIWAY